MNKRKDDKHHIIPRSLGGNDDSKNLIPLCKKCHLNVHSYNLENIERLRILIIKKEEAYNYG